MRALIAAVGGLDVDGRLSAAQLKGFRIDLHGNPVGGSGERLAIGAMAYAHRFRIYLRLERDVSAVTCAFNLHGRSSDVKVVII